MSCSLCASGSLQVVSKVDAKSSKPLEVVVCKQCSMVQQARIPTLSELEEFYTNEYRIDYKKTYEPKPKHVYRAGKLSVDRLNFLKDCGVQPARHLDVGAGGGEFVYLANSQGFDSSGIEPNLGYSEYASREYGIAVNKGQLEDITETYDLVTMFHVMEHMSLIEETFQKLWEVLNPGKLLFIEVPNISAKNASPNNIYFKAHIFYFNSATLVASASPYFECVKVDDGPNLRVLFKRRDTPGELQLPDSAQVQQQLDRLFQKGWVEYLTQGGGLLKWTQTLKKLWVESKVQGDTGKIILNRMMLNSK